MADWSMEVPAGEWTPGDLQLANWTTEPAVYAFGIPSSMEYAPTEIFGTSCYQTCIPIPDYGEQLCGYEVATRYDRNQAAAQQEDYSAVHHPQSTVIMEDPLSVLNIVTNACNDDVIYRKHKMHRYPASIQALCLDKRYTTPKVVAIGPYHHESERLQQAQKIKYVAMYKCLKESKNPRRLECLYIKVALEADDARNRNLYDRDIGYQDFRDMMLTDACFLVQYMFLRGDYDRSKEMDTSLVAFYDANDSDIFHDIMLLENQIPWAVVQSVIDSMDDKDCRGKYNKLLRNFIYYHKDCLRDLKRTDTKGEHFELHEYKPPHLLGLLRYYIVGRNNDTEPEELKLDNTISFSVGAIELSQIGIKLKGNENCEELRHMGVQINYIVGCSELFLAPVTLDDTRVSCLISMAAHELCIHPNFHDDEVKVEDSAVCSYLLLLAMLVATEEDVQKLREKHVLLGGGLADKDVLEFVAKLHDLRLGACYVRVMKEIEDYRSLLFMFMFITAYKFVSKHEKTIYKLLVFVAGSGGLTALIQKLLCRR